MTDQSFENYRLFMTIDSIKHVLFIQNYGARGSGKTTTYFNIFLENVTWMEKYGVKPEELIKKHLTNAPKCDII